MEGAIKGLGTIMTLLIIWGVITVLAGGRPKPCPPHICYPKERIVTAADLVAQRQAERAAVKTEESSSASNSAQRNQPSNGWK